MTNLSWRQDWRTADSSQRRYTASTIRYSYTVTVRDDPAGPTVRWEGHAEPRRPTIPGGSLTATGRGLDDASALDDARIALTVVEKFG